MIRPIALVAAAMFTVAAPVVAADTPEAAPEILPEVLPEVSPETELVITEAGEQLLDEFLYIARVLVIFADSPNDPRFVQQMEYLGERPEDLRERDVVVITDTDPAAKSPIREALRPRGFDLVLIGKDGQRYLRKPLPWSTREITRSIDKMPQRQQELRDMRAK
ncbi:DUF4174 domain-containing protein [Maritimibacter fusiformis]|uniref:DUF4174 domain-containing protein n=1 Tax=Maritimibacter fusiformis TaxID=2603819 RepID=A0A5D0RNF7_9RHOB|nr:DUF4174 domain-containing protein [Maritimibacter fusiformis]TYB83082.1 DUF4174 domain-containing protein [Maritimibacter fusiformis]